MKWEKEAPTPAGAEMLDQEPAAPISKGASNDPAGIYTDMVNAMSDDLAKRIKDGDVHKIIAKGAANAQQERHKMYLINNAAAARYMTETPENLRLRAEALGALPEALRDLLVQALSRTAYDMESALYTFAIRTMNVEGEKLLPKHKQVFEDHAQDVVDAFDAKLTRAMEGVEAKLAEFLVTIDARVESAVQMIAPGSFSLISKESEPNPYDASEL